MAISLARGFPLEGRELDSAVEGVQKYLESSGFPKMTRGEVMDFLNDFSRNSRVSRSENTGGSGKKDNPPRTDETSAASSTTASGTSKIPKGESPLNYGYPMSMQQQDTETATRVASTTPMIFVTAAPVVNSTRTDEKKPPQQLLVSDVLRNAAAPKKSIVPPADLNAYSKFKKIPEARNLKIDDDMKDFLSGFGLLDDATTPKSPAASDTKPQAKAQRRNDDIDVTGSMDQKLLESILAETGNVRSANLSRSLQPFLDSVTNRADHVFNPSDSRVKTVDVNRIAKIVENIRLLSEDNNTIALPQDMFQEKLENITAAIAAIDQPTDDNKVFNDGYEVFFDDNSKEIDSDLPETPVNAVVGAESLDKVRNPPDPLSTDELQQLFEKNKNDVKRQEPAAADDTARPSTVADDVVPSSTEQQTARAASTTAPTTTPTPPPARTTSASTTTDSSSEASSTVQVTSDATAARILSTTAADDTNPSLSQLAESFGGSETSSEAQQTDVIDTPSNRPRNGLYFYVDWNSFLTVNQGQKNQVNLRFAPKAGNPAHFLRVNVP